MAPISISDIKAYIELFKVSDVESFLEIITFIDLEYRRAYHKRLKEELEQNNKRRW